MLAEKQLKIFENKKPNKWTGFKNPQWKGGPIEIICESCKKKKIVWPYQKRLGQGRFCNSICANNWIAKVYNKDEKHHEWKGDNVGNGALHSWIIRKLGRPKICENCGITTKKIYHWARLSLSALRNFDDWMRLCVPCHKKYDLHLIKVKRNFLLDTNLPVSF